MAYVVTEPCLDCKYTDCAAVCPTQAFRQAADHLVIDPDACIDCDACVPQCPVDAIYADKDVPAQWQSWIQLNATEAPKMPMIDTRVQPMLGPRCKDQATGKVKPQQPGASANAAT